jgi:hypothetical protein
VATRSVGSKSVDDEDEKDMMNRTAHMERKEKKTDIRVRISPAAGSTGRHGKQPIMACESRRLREYDGCHTGVFSG